MTIAAISFITTQVQGQAGFDHFDIETPPKGSNRALRFTPKYYQGNTFSAWFGYGFNWDLTPQYFNTISKLKFKAMGSNQSTRVQKFIKTAGAGNSNMVLIDEFDVATVKYYLITVGVAGAPGVAQANLQVYDPIFNHRDQRNNYLPGGARVRQPGARPESLLGRRDPAGRRCLVYHGRGAGD